MCKVKIIYDSDTEDEEEDTQQKMIKQIEDEMMKLVGNENEGIKNMITNFMQSDQAVNLMELLQPHKITKQTDYIDEALD